MKTISIAVWCVLLAGAAWSDTAPVPTLAAPNIELTVTLHGEGAKRIPVVLYRETRTKTGEEQYWKGVTDKKGKLRPPSLAEGWYRIFADAGKRDASLYLTVLGQEKKRAPFEMKLARPFPLGAAEDDPVSVHVMDFRGVVLDQSGAVLPQSDIEILRRNDLDAGAVAKIQSDEKGEFSLHLDKGIYAAVFHHLNFKRRVVVFEVTEKGEKELRTTLEIGTT